MSARLWIMLGCTLGLLPLLGCGSSDAPTAVTAQINGEGGAANAAPGSTDQAGSGQKVASAPTGDPLHPIVEIQTTLGKITLELDGEHAPGTVRNFLNYVNGGVYKDSLIHYVDSGSMVLGGGFNAQLEPLAVSAPIRNEAHNGLKNTPGTIAMSRPFDAIDGATSQFFFNVKENPALDHQGPTEEDYGYCVFGKVTQGWEVVEKISQAPVHTEGEFVNTPQQRMVIQSMKFIR